VITAQGWPAGGFSNGYVILTPQNVNVCVDWAFDGFTLPCSTNVFCAYHTWGDLAAPPNLPKNIYAVEPYYTSGDCDAYLSRPHGDDADIAINTLSHEMNEFITDPTGGGWWDVNG